jgi:hypothetical protein
MHMLLIVIILVSMVGVIVYIGSPIISIMKLVGNKTAVALDSPLSYSNLTEPYSPQRMNQDTSILVTIGSVVGAGVLYNYAKGEQKKQPTQILFRPQKKPVFRDLMKEHNLQKQDNERLIGHTKFGAPRILLPKGMSIKQFNELGHEEKEKALGITIPKITIIPEAKHSAANSKGYRMKYSGEETSVSKSENRPMPQETYKKRPTRADIERIGREVFGEE